MGRLRYFVPFYRRSRTCRRPATLELAFRRLGADVRVPLLHADAARAHGRDHVPAGAAAGVLIGWELRTFILVTGVSVTILYSFTGGIEAVIWTDVVQSFVLIGGALVCLAILLLRMPEGPGQVFRLAGDHEIRPR